MLQCLATVTGPMHCLPLQNALGLSHVLFKTWTPPPQVFEHSPAFHSLQPPSTGAIQESIHVVLAYIVQFLLLQHLGSSTVMLTA